MYRSNQIHNNSIILKKKNIRLQENKDKSLVQYNILDYQKKFKINLLTILALIKITINYKTEKITEQMFY